MTNPDDTISISNEEDYGDIKSNLEEVAKLLSQSYNELLIHLQDISEYSEDLKDNYTNYYESMLEADNLIT